MHVGSIINTKLRQVINKTSTKWMKQQMNEPDDSIRPHTTQKVESKRIRSHTAQKDSISNRRTTASTGGNGSKKAIKHHAKYGKVNSFLIQSSWIPNSYRVNKAPEISSKDLDMAKRENGVDRSIIPKVKPVKFQNPSKKIMIRKNSNKAREKLEKKHTQEIAYFPLENLKTLHTGSLDDYSLIELLGKGSYATVYLARALNRDNQQVAVKIFDGDKKSRSIKEEIQILKMLSHPYVISFYDAFVAHSKQHIVLEHAEGMSLLKSLKMCRKYTENDAKKVFKKILEGVEYLHNQGIAHRDLKLENIIIDKTKDIKIIDFGFATFGNKEDRSKIF